MSVAEARAPSGGSMMRYLPIAALAAGLGAFFAFGGADYISLEALAENRDALQAWAGANLLLAALAYLALYIAATALSLPVGTVLTLAGGFVFGTWLGGALTAVAATVGATLLFAAARTAFADYFRDRLGDKVARTRQKFEDDAFSYILALRLAPIFPFAVVNVLPALAGARLKDYVAATFIGILPGTFVYASVGAGLDAVFAEGGTPDLGVIFQPSVFVPLLLLALLALAPMLWKRFKRAR